MYSNNILNFQESTTILNACTKCLETYWMHHVYILSKADGENDSILGFLFFNIHVQISYGDLNLK